jgi:hypothetical protein
MTTKQKREQPDELERPAGETRNVLIGKQVMDILGEPEDLFRVQVRHLWECSYRVNVFVGPDAISARIANSHFLKVDDDGTIIASMPRIKRQYNPPLEVPAAVSPSAACV